MYVLLLNDAVFNKLTGLCSFPWSCFFKEEQVLHVEQEEDVGCKTVTDHVLGSVLWGFVQNYFWTLWGTISGFSFGWYKLTQVMKSVAGVKDVVEEQSKRLSGEHGNTYVNRVSLSLNILSPYSGGGHHPQRPGTGTGGHWELQLR